MKKIIFLLLISATCNGQNQAKTIIVHGDSLWLKNMTTGDSTPINKTGLFMRYSDSAAAFAAYQTAINSKQPALGFTPYNATNPSGYLVPADISAKTGQVAAVNLVGQTANIAATTLYAVPATGTYRISVYISVATIGTTSTMPSTTITYTDGISSTVHSTATTATSTGNSLSATFAQSTYLCYAKTGTNIQYTLAGYASTGTPMQYHIRIRVETI